MRVHTKIVLQMTDTIGEYILVEEQGFDYEGPVERCKGDSTLQQEEQSQAAFSQELTNIFTAQYGQQSAVLDFLKNTLEPQISNPQGYSDSALAAMRAQATDSITANYNNAQAALQNGPGFNPNLPSGVAAMQEGALKTAEAGDLSNAENTITLNNENLKQQNYWNAMNVLSGNVASQFNPLGYASADTTAASSTANLGTAYKNSQSSQLLGVLGGIAGGAGSALSGYFTKTCWIAAELYGGWMAPRTVLVRNYLNGEFCQTLHGDLIMCFYRHYGWRIAKAMRRFPILKLIFRPIFNVALKRARNAFTV